MESIQIENQAKPQVLTTEEIGYLQSWNPDLKFDEITRIDRNLKTITVRCTDGKTYVAPYVLQTKMLAVKTWNFVDSIVQ